MLSPLLLAAASSYPPALLPPSVETWRCAPLSTSKLPPIAMIVYLLKDLLGSFGYLVGSNESPSINAYRQMFGYTTESELGTLYLVVDPGTELYQLSALIGMVNRSGDVGARSCDRLHTTVIRRPHVKSSHYSTRHAMTKLDVLEHLPRDLPAVALLDTDTFCIADCASRLHAQHRAMVRSSETPRSWRQRDRRHSRVRRMATPQDRFEVAAMASTVVCSCLILNVCAPLRRATAHIGRGGCASSTTRMSRLTTGMGTSGSGSICSNASQGCGTSCRVGCTRRSTSFGAQRSSSLWVPPESVRIMCTRYAILILKAGGPKLRAQSWMATLATIGSKGCRRHSSARAPRMISAGGASALLILCHRVMTRG